MITLLFNGSPHRDGHTAALLSELRRALPGEIHEIACYDAGVAPCIDCGWCEAHAGCSIDDAMTAIYPLIDAADNIVIASPLHFSSLTGSLLSLFSRLQSVYAARKREAASGLLPPLKKGLIVLTGGGHTKNNDTAERTANILLKTMGAQTAATVVSLHTDTVPAKEDAAALRAIRVAARLLSEQENCIET